MSKKKVKNKKNKEVIGIYEESIMSLLSKSPYSIKRLCQKLKVKNEKEQFLVIELLGKLEGKGKVVKIGDDQFKAIKQIVYMTGKVDYVSARFAFIITEESEKDIWVSAKDLNYALDGDLVKVMLFDKGDKTKRPEGKVVEIIERSKKTYVGRVQRSPKFAFVIPDSKKMFYDIFIKNDGISGVEEDDKVIVEIVEWPSREKNPVGIIIKVLGKAGQHQTEMHSIMAEFNLPFEFPERPEKEAENIPVIISSDEIRKRRDFRSITTFTIDPVDAKDFDDAISIQQLEENLWEIGVHIADVTHYVQPGSYVEQEAFDRATSVYLVDRVIPMLPEKLSNELCSLRPHEDKLTFSAVFQLNAQGAIVKEWFGKTIIHSIRRFTYEEAQEAIESGQGDFFSELRVLNSIAKQLREKRYKQGAISFETVEVKFKLGPQGEPLGIFPKVRKDAHKLVEEFMLLANKRVAEYVYQQGKGKTTMVYRTHDFPDPEKVNAFAVFAKKFGHQLEVDENKLAHSLNELGESIEGKPEQNVLQSLAIRAMSKAKYTTEPDGHFGLAFQHYTHFTSPIRRYPDMMAHRLLEHYLQGGKSVDKDEYEEKCLHSSEMEKRAADAERASIKYKQAEFMSKAEDKPYAGIVSGVTEWGVYVELVETKCEGMVKVSDLDDDYYEYDADNFRIVGRYHKRTITLGDLIDVRIKEVNLEKRTIDLVLAKKK